MPRGRKKEENQGPNYYQKRCPPGCRRNANTRRKRPRLQSKPSSRMSARQRRELKKKLAELVAAAQRRRAEAIRKQGRWQQEEDRPRRW